MFLEVEIDENMLKAKTIDVAFWRYNNFSEFRTAENNWNQIRDMVHSDAIWNDVLEVGTAVKN